MRKNTGLDLRVDMIGMVTGCARSIGYARFLRREVFESAQEMCAYFGARPGTDFERSILENCK